MTPEELARSLIIGIGRVGGRALAKAAQSIAQDGIAALGSAQAKMKAAHDKLENIVEAPTVAPPPARAAGARPIRRV